MSFIPFDRELNDDTKPKIWVDFSKKNFDGFLVPYKNVCKKKNLVKSVAKNRDGKK